jgi:hypothetical protein
MGHGMGDSDRHQRLTGSALANYDRRSRCFEMLGNTGESQSLSWKRLPSEGLDCWRKGIAWPLQWRVHLDDTCPELLREKFEDIRNNYPRRDSGGWK